MFILKFYSFIVSFILKFCSDIQFWFRFFEDFSLCIFFPALCRIGNFRNISFSFGTLKRASFLDALNSFGYFSSCLFFTAFYTRSYLNLSFLFSTLKRASSLEALICFEEFRFCISFLSLS